MLQHAKFQSCNFKRFGYRPICKFVDVPNFIRITCPRPRGVMGDFVVYPFYTNCTTLSLTILRNC